MPQVHATAMLEQLASKPCYTHLIRACSIHVQSLILVISNSNLSKEDYCDREGQQACEATRTMQILFRERERESH